MTETKRCGHVDLETINRCICMLSGSVVNIFVVNFYVFISSSFSFDRRYISLKIQHALDIPLYTVLGYVYANTN